jgi:hypothetical protein
MEEKCGHCPLGDAPCKGTRVPRYCQLVDPAHPSFDARYIYVLKGEQIPPEEKGPSLLEKAGNLAVALIKHAADRFRTVDQNTKIYRLSICQSCEHMTKERACTVCGCFLDEKVTWCSEECPLQKWLKANCQQPEVVNPPKGKCCGH